MVSKDIDLAFSDDSTAMNKLKNKNKFGKTNKLSIFVLIKLVHYVSSRSKPEVLT